jgi:uncharacterized membrane protein
VETFSSGINNQGQVIGTYLIIDWDTFDFYYHGFVYDKGFIRPLTPLAQDRCGRVYLVDINNPGQIIGSAFGSTT